MSRSLALLAMMGLGGAQPVCNGVAGDHQDRALEEAPLVVRLASCDPHTPGVIAFEVKNLSPRLVTVPLHVLPSVASSALEFGFSQIDSKLVINLDRVDVIDDTLATVSISPGGTYRSIVDINERYPALLDVIEASGVLIHWSVPSFGGAFPVRPASGAIAAKSDECVVAP